MNTRNTLSFANFAAVCSSMLLAGALSAQAADTKPQREPADVVAAQASDAKADAHAQKKAYYKKLQDKQDQADSDAARGSDQPELDPIKLDPMDQPERDAMDYPERDRKVGAGEDSDQLEQGMDTVSKKQAHYDRKKQQDRAAANGNGNGQDSDELEQDAATIDPVPQNKPLPRPAKLALDIEAIDGGLTISMQRDTNELWVGAILGSLDSRTRQFGELPPLLGDATVLAAGIVSQDMPGRQIFADVRHGGFDFVGFYVQGVAFTLGGAQATDVKKATFGQGDER